MPALNRPLAFLAIACCVPGAAPLEAQTAAKDFEAKFSAVWDLAPATDHAGEVNNLVIEREEGRFELAHGRLTFLTPLDGRTVGAVWQGSGMFRLNPDDPSERERLQRILGAGDAAVGISELVMFFSDSIATDLAAKLGPAGAGPIPAMHSRVADALDYIGDESDRELDVDLMGLMLNGTPTGLFYAYVTRPNGAPFMFVSNPNVREGVRLLSKSKGMGRVGVASGAVRVRGAAEKMISDGESRQGDVEIRHYVIETTLPGTMTGDVAFQAKADMTLEADAPVSGWVPFELFEKLRVDSATWSSGEPAGVYKPKNSDVMWVHLPGKLVAGDSLFLRVAYHGDLTERYNDFFFIRTSTAWYPQALEERSKATFDLTFHTPRQFTLVSVGEIRDSSVSGNMVTTRWVSTAPMRNASFNFGIFEVTQVNNEGAPPVTVLWNADAHRAFAQAQLQEKSMEKRVGNDVSSALQFYKSVYGDPGINHFYATEIAELHGEAFPGFVNLSYVTFVQTDRGGSDEVFRAHEVAHQWWGIGVDFASYRDQWLSEGLSDFSGLWYLQVVRKQPQPYFNQLRLWKTSIISRSSAGPVSLGYRVITDRNEGDYQVIVYQKGAWIMHMLRTLMINLKTMQEDRFQAMMRDFFTTYDGRYATTDDFQRIVEKHAGQSMAWFFDEWVRGTGIPTYRVAWTATDAGDGTFRATLKVKQEGVASTFQMYVPVTVVMSDKSQLRTRVLVKGPETVVQLPPLPSQPKSLTFNDFEGVLATVAEVDGPN